jgi:quercetin dioxygenase-like cupin family protein
MARVRRASEIRTRRPDGPGWTAAGERLLAGQAQGCGAFTVRVISLKSGGRTPRIERPGMRLVLVLAGEVLFMDGDGNLSMLGAGDVLIVDPRERHHFQNDSGRPVELLYTDDQA